MRRKSIRTWALAFGFSVAPTAAMSADVTPPPSEPLPDAFYISPSVGVMNFDLPDIKANVLSVDGNTGQAIDIKPDLDRLAPVLGGSFGARLGEYNGSTVRLRGSGFYSWVDSDDTVSLDEFGGFVWKGLTDSSPTTPQAAAAAAVLGPSPAAAAASAGSGLFPNTFTATQTGSSPPSATAEAGAFNESGGLFVAAGDLSAFDLAIHYDEDLAYWGGEFALAFDSGPSESGVVFTPFIGPIVRGIDRDLKTTLTDNVFPISLSLHESLDGRYYGGVVGVDMVVPVYNGMAVDLSVSAAPLYLDADYEGHEVNSSGGTPLEGPKIDDSDGRLAGLLRAQAGLDFPVFGHSWLRVGGQVEYLTDAPTIERDIGSAAVAAIPDAAAAAAAGGSREKLAKLAFDDMFAYGFNASLVIPFGP